jgi:hypothetical protein
MRVADVGDDGAVAAVVVAVAENDGVGDRQADMMNAHGYPAWKAIGALPEAVVAVASIAAGKLCRMSLTPLVTVEIG